MDAMLWWLIPITATLLAVAWVSWNGRTRRPADPHDTLAAHRRFTEALASPAPEDPTEGAEQTDDSGPAAERRRSA
jgi:hypothetical protein